MKKNIFPFIMFIAFIVFTILVKYVDVQPIGPKESLVGFATINFAIHRFCGVHWFTDILGGILISVVMLGFFNTQLIFLQSTNKKKSRKKLS